MFQRLREELGRGRYRRNHRSPDGHVIYFSCTRPNNGQDIYFAEH